MAGSKRNEIRTAVQRRVKRFSPFELLGLEGGTSPPPLPEPERSGLLSDSTAVGPGKKLPDPPLSDGGISDRLIYQTSDGLTVHQTPPDGISDPLISDPLIDGPSDSTSDGLIEGRGDIPPAHLPSPSAIEAVPLAPLQWRVWQVLLETEGRVISHRGLATQINGSIPGVRQAIQVIEREGGIRFRQTVREKTQEGAILQGFRVTLNRAIPFQQISSQEAAWIQKRGLTHRHISDGLIYPPVGISDRLRMYVYNNKIHTYIPELLRLFPKDWQIREQTLIKIAEAFPDMSLLELRRSIRYLVEQAQTGKSPVQNPNAWLKAAFERNKGPLITERMIEAQIDQQGVKMNEERPPPAETGQDLDTLRLYVAASAEDKADIDRMAEKRVGRLLATVSADKHAGIREQARIECARKFFAARRK
jgi:hypothetical protein